MIACHDADDVMIINIIIAVIMILFMTILMTMILIRMVLVVITITLVLVLGWFWGSTACWLYLDLREHDWWTPAALQLVGVS